MVSESIPSEVSNQYTVHAIYSGRAAGAVSGQSRCNNSIISP